MCAHILRNARAELFGPRDQVVFEVGFQELAAGESRSFSRTVLLENNWHRFFLLVRVDTCNATIESNKRNNGRFISVRTRDLR